jgi:hypothetical protein
VQHGLVRIPVNPPRVVVGYAPFTAGKRLLHLELAVLEAQQNVAFRRVHPVVETPVESVCVLLDPCLAAAIGVGHQLLLVHLEVAVGVLHQPDVRRLGDKHAGIEDLD